MDVVATPRRTPHARAPRVDAQRNRERIVAAARDLFTEVGRQAPIDEVARRAGIGNATVYRHFPDRDALVLAVVHSVLKRAADRAEAAMAQAEEPFEALSRFVLAAADEQIGATCVMLDGAYDPGDPEVKVLEERLNGLLDTMLARARRAGLLRPGIDRDDIFVGVAQLTRPLPDLVTVRRGSRRYLQLFLDGLRAPGYTALPVEN
ncbi:TetR/AcrR family transcriptional regulator [Catenulispora sp. NF23]|uniref:TetR/AcrR family transcriptional regulator n=1 Tax=Catenulispora pinistramenti TaxID=2705254 RepID=A0ABS5KP77_9ACTN|nr:TetR/AcrR family transcriptional regulator [Catenulispora pinistramenti]MBS2532307.1 TetR/AcrR family transcriptional regulator [Catenulispora pinistramenti]MBS2547832.1 TetR/AcrR family transcriptional regulator [Catenulispora pinistramenti]